MSPELYMFLFKSIHSGSDRTSAGAIDVLATIRSSDGRLSQVGMSWLVEIAGAGEQCRAYAEEAFEAVKFNGTRARVERRALDFDEVIG